MKASITLGILALAGALTAVGCEDTATPGTDPGDDDGGAPATTTCPTPTGEGTVHESTIEANEVWTAAASPHRVNFDVVVRAGATLTVEPCAVIEVAAGRGISVDDGEPGKPAALIAHGSAAKPIVFRGQKDAARWRGLSVSAPSRLELAHVRLDGGGDSSGDAAMLQVYGDGVLPADPVVLLDAVTLQNARGAALRMERGATFLPGSKDLVVTRSGDGQSQYPVEIEEHSMDALPTGTYTGNVVDEILLQQYGTGVVGGGLAVDATLRQRGVPYHVGRTHLDPFVIGSGVDGEMAVMTIEPGVILRMHPGTSFKIQHWTTDRPATGALRAIGTAEAQIVFTSAAASPAPGDWMGLWFGGVPSDRNSIELARIEYAGGECSCILVSCSAITQSEGAVIFTAQPPSRFIRNTIISDSASHAFTQGFDGSSLDFTQSNFFSNVAGCMLTEPRNADTSCPVNPKQPCR